MKSKTYFSLRSFWLVLFYLLVCSGEVYCQTSGTLHFIYFSDTNDSEIGKSSEEANRYFIYNFLPTVKANTSMNVKSYCFYGSDFQRSKLNGVINSLQTNSNDAIFFFYTGHGFNEDHNDFPTLTLGLRSDAITSRTKSLLSVYNSLRSKPHRFLLVMAESCNAVYGSRSQSGNYTGNYDAYEGDNTNLRKLFEQTSGDYLMSSSVKGEKSFCPTGSLGYFTRGFRDALDERTSSFSITSFLDKVAHKTTKYAADYAAEDQHPQWLSGGYVDGKSLKPSYSASHGISSKKGEIKNVSVITLEENLVAKVSFSIRGMKDKKGLVSCYFYDENGHALKAPISNYTTSDGDVCSSVSITPPYENTAYTDLDISIPKNKLNLSGTYSRTLKVMVVVWDNSSSGFQELFRSGNVDFTYKPLTDYLKVNGSSSNISVNFDQQGGRKTFNVSTSDQSYDIWGVPSWCEIVDKTPVSFVLKCYENASVDEKEDYMIVKAAGKEVRIDISQDKKKGPLAVIDRVWVDHNKVRGYGYGATNGMIIHIKFDVENMINQKVTVQALFYYGDNSTPLMNGYGGQVSISDVGNVNHVYGTFEDFEIYFPYAQLRMYGHGSSNLSFDILVKDSNGNTLTRKNNIQFMYTQ